MTTKILLLLVAALLLAGFLSKKRAPRVRRTDAPKVEAASKCAVCGVYTLADAPPCGRADCPRPV